MRNTLSSQLAQFKSCHVDKGSLLAVKTDISYFAFFIIPVPVNSFVTCFQIYYWLSSLLNDKIVEKEDRATDCEREDELKVFADLSLLFPQSQ